MKSERSRSNRQEIEKRQQAIISFLDQGVTQAEVLPVVVKQFGLSERQAYRCIQAAQALRHQSLSNTTLEALMGDLYSKAMYEYRQALKQAQQNQNPLPVIKSLDLCLQILKEKSKMKGSVANELPAVGIDDLSDGLEALLQDDAFSPETREIDPSGFGSPDSN